MFEEDSGRGRALVDNAFLFSVASIFIRIKRNLRIRNVDILGLSALVDAIIMHRRLAVDSSGWAYFEEHCPTRWLPFLVPYIDIIEFNLPSFKLVVPDIAANDQFWALGYLFGVADSVGFIDDKRLDFRNLYFSYTSSDVAEGTQEQELIHFLENNRPSRIPEMMYYLRHNEHVSSVQCLIRALQYQAFAVARGEAYLSQEFRGRVLRFFGRYQSSNEFRVIWDRIMLRIVGSIEKEHKTKLSWTSDYLKDSAIWSELEMPLFLAMALRRTKSIDDLFFEVTILRDKAFTLRQLLEEMTYINDQKNLDKTSNEAKQLAYAIDDVRAADHRTKISASIGFPWSFSVDLKVDLSRQNRGVSFIRDIYDNYAIPLRLSADIERVFGNVKLQSLVTEPIADKYMDRNFLDQIGDRLDADRIK